MKENDAFEERLRQQQIKGVPESWRAEILESAKSAAGATPARNAGDLMRGRAASSGWVLSALRRAAAELICPSRKAWAGLGVAWGAIILVSFVSREPNEASPASSGAPSPLARELLKEQAQLLSDSSGASEPIDAVMPRPKSGPRSQSKNPWSAV